jgi:hypothetical protein
VARLGDADSRVRKAAGTACGAVAEQMRDYFGEEPMTGGDVATNPLLRGIFSAVTEQNRELQAAASHAFALAASHIQPLAPALLRQLLKALDSPGFPAKAELWPAFAHLFGGASSGSRPAEVQGLVRSSLAVVQDHMGLIVGVAGPGQARAGGLLGALAAPEWQARKAAAETLQVKRILGWLHAHAVQHKDLKKAAKDRIMDSTSCSGEPNKWVCAQALAVALGPDWDGTGATSPGSSNAQLLNALVEELAAAKYDKVKPAREAMQAAFAACAAVQQMVGGGGGSDPCQAASEGLLRDSMGARGQRSRVGSPGAASFLPPEFLRKGKGQPPAEAVPQPTVPAGQPHLADSSDQFNIAALKSPIGSIPSHHLTASACTGSLTLASLHAEQQRMAAALHLLTSSTSAALAQLQQHISSLELQINAVAGTGQEAPAGMGCALPPSQDAQPPEPARCSSPVGVGLPPAQPAHGPRPAVHKPGSPSKAQALADLRASHGQLLDELQSLRSSLDSLGTSTATLVAPPPGPAGGRVGEEAGAAADSPAASVDAMFSRLVCCEGGIMNELKLLRAMNRTSPVWEQLSSTTAQGMLQALQHLLEVRPSGCPPKRVLSTLS